MMSNTQFAETMGYHHSTVSRLRHGQRLPSLPQLVRICDANDLDLAKYVRAHVEGPEVFSALLRKEVLGEDELWEGELPEEAAGFEG